MADASKPPLRFNINAKVECNVGTFVRGTVVALHYREPDWPPGRYAPYQVQLDDGRLIYAPHDHDKLIRLCRVYPLVNAAFASANGKIDVLAKAIEQAASGEGMTQMDVVDVNEADAAGLTVLGIVCARGDVAAAKLLVENGADVLGMDGSGRVPLHHAVSRRRPCTGPLRSSSRRRPAQITVAEAALSLSVRPGASDASAAMRSQEGGAPEPLKLRRPPDAVVAVMSLGSASAYSLVEHVILPLHSFAVQYRQLLLHRA